MKVGRQLAGNPPTWFVVSVLAFMGIARAGLIYYATVWGPAVYSDGAGFIDYVGRPVRIFLQANLLYRPMELRVRIAVQILKW